METSKVDQWKQSAEDLLTFQKQCPPKAAFASPLKPSERECRDYSSQIWTDYVLQDLKDPLLELVLELWDAPFLATLKSQDSPPCSPMDYKCDQLCHEQRECSAELQTYFPWLYSQEIYESDLESDENNLEQVFPTQSYYKTRFKHHKTSQRTGTLKSVLDVLDHRLLKDKLLGLRLDNLEPPLHLALLLSTVLVISMIKGQWLGDSQQANKFTSLLQGNKPENPFGPKQFTFLTTLVGSYFHLRFAFNVEAPEVLALNELVSTYKIHITPRLPYYFSVLRAIIRARENDNFLKKNINYIKVCVYLSQLQKSYNEGGMIAPIVLYLQQEEIPSPGHQVGQEVIFNLDALKSYWYNMRQKVFDVLEKLFIGLKKSLDPDGYFTHRSLHEEYGSGLIVRGNYPFTKLINVAHYLGDDNPDYFDKLNNEANYQNALRKFPISYGDVLVNEDITRTQYYKAKNRIFLEDAKHKTKSTKKFDFLPISMLQETSMKFFSDEILEKEITAPDDDGLVVQKLPEAKTMKSMADLNGLNGRKNRKNSKNLQGTKCTLQQ
eukprot:Nk52_evm63s226 gene=Nk52_evmTU63s226